MTRLRQICSAAAFAAIATIATVPPARAEASAPPTTEASTAAPTATNDLLPEANNLDNCVGTAESANCGSRARADGHTYLVFTALAGGLGFIGWRISRGVRARDRAPKPTP